MPLDTVTGSITATFRNPQAADPFIVGEYEPYSVTKDNFPRVQVIFTGTITPRGAAAITGRVTSENRFVAKNSAELPETGFDFIVVDGTTSYTGGTETITGTIANSAGTNLAVLDLTRDVPILRWSDGTFDSIRKGTSGTIRSSPASRGSGEQPSGFHRACPGKRAMLRIPSGHRWPSSGWRASISPVSRQPSGEERVPGGGL